MGNHKNNLLSVIKNSIPNLSKSHKKIAMYILDHYDKSAFMTASKLASIVGTSESTVVRFAFELGFDGYPEFQTELRELIKNKLTTVQRMEITSSKMDDKSILKSVMQSDAENIRQTLENIDNNDFLSAVDALTKCNKIYI